MWAQIEDNVVKLYGTIWTGDGQYIVQDLAPVLKNFKSIDIHLHTPGGSVIDANLIYNSLISSGVHINMYIDGLAASMGSIIMLAGTKIYMVENGFVMIHAPSGSVEGNASQFEKTAKLLKSIEENFIKKYSARTGRPIEELTDWMQGDNWFSASEALAAGLVDEIIDPVLQLEDFSAFGEYNLAAFSKSFESFNISQTEYFAQQSLNSNNQKQTGMKLNAKSLEILGVAEGATDEQVNEKIHSLQARAVTAETELQTANNAIAAATTAKIEALVSKGIAEGRFLSTEKEDFTALATSNYELAEKTIAKLPGKPNLSGRIIPEAGETVEGREKWTFIDWSKNDTVGLLAMKKDNPEAYKELCAKAGIKLN